MQPSQPKGAKISDKPRFEQTKSDTPGPGAYQEVVAPKKVFSSGSKVKRTSRFEETKKTIIKDPIGPGYYDANPLVTRPKT